MQRIVETQTEIKQNKRAAEKSATQTIKRINYND